MHAWHAARLSGNTASQSVVAVTKKRCKPTIIAYPFSSCANFASWSGGIAGRLKDSLDPDVKTRRFVPMDPSLALAASTRQSSSIPRPSRLPVSTISRRSILESQQLSKDRDKADGPILKPKEAVPKQAAANRSIRRDYAPAKAIPVVASKSTTSVKTAETPTSGTTVFKRLANPPQSRLAQQRQALPLPDALSRAVGLEEDAHDKLGALDGFRAASRNGYREQPMSVVADQPVEVATEKASKPRKSSRPSLSDRTIESLSQLPSTPSERRRSSFFAPESPMAPPSRPGSSIGNTRRPGTSDGTFGVGTFARPLSPAKRPPSSAKASGRISNSFQPTLTPSRRSVSAAIPRQPAESPSVLQKHAPLSKISGTTKSAGLDASGIRTARRPLSNSKTVALRPGKVRPTAKSLFSKAELSAGHTETEPLAPSVVLESAQKSPHSSAALREQIAKAKAARKAAAARKDDMSAAPIDSGYDLDVDPFNQRSKDRGGLLRKRIDSTRADGRLNVAAMGLSCIPDEVLQMYDADQMLNSDIAWNESVDLVRLNAADNDITSIDHQVFPDVDAEILAQNDDFKGSQFGGLEALDLHGNQLSAVPTGLRRLERLTSLNLISSLRDLNLGHNPGISGTLPSSIAQLTNLEGLDLQANRLLNLPACLRALIHLRVLKVSGNQLTSLPFDSLKDLPLVELDASKNALLGALLPTELQELTYLRSLDVANNSLTSLTFAEHFSFPALQTLNVSGNRLTILPDVKSWAELVTLAAEDNKIFALPPGFTKLTKLRNADFTRNELVKLDDEIAGMQSLERLLVAANPLRDRKLLGMNAADIKQALRARLEPTQWGDGESSKQLSNDVEDAVLCEEDKSPKWTLKAGRVLDLSALNMTSLPEREFELFVGDNDIRQLQLSHNRLECLPSCLGIAANLRTLDLSNNTFGVSYLSGVLSLSSLQELNLSGNGITSLALLMQCLDTPSLQHLNVSNNRVSGHLPLLRRCFPSLITLLMRDNKLTAISAANLEGLRNVDLTRNDIASLPADIGLLWDKGLRSFEVGSNAFRVPNYRVLDKGTDATLAWLRDRIPAKVNTRARVEEERDWID
ncbi:hypothetical protein LTR28_010557 [Elasticomyces elasticus]|nr:hypothetical protein LTR28_010557 [Elasticomyces elasticus]